MDTMDRFQAVVANSALPVMLCGTSDAAKIVLLDFETDLAPEDNDKPLGRDLTGLTFLGCVGLGVDGPLVAWAMHLSDDAQKKLADAYVAYVMPYLQSRIDVTPDYLHALHSLKDPRPN